MSKNTNRKLDAILVRLTSVEKHNKTHFWLKIVLIILVLLDMFLKGGEVNAETLITLFTL